MPKRNLIFLIIIIVASVLTLHLNLSIARHGPDHSLFDPLVDVTDLIHRNYVEDTDDQELIDAAINGMLHQLDPYSEYIPPAEVAEFHKRTSGSYEGIGIGIDLQDGFLTVISPFEDSPAYRAGILPGDIILEVNGQSTKGWSATKAVNELTGPADTSVTLKILHPDGSEVTLTITRGQIHVPTVRGWQRKSLDGSWDYLFDDEDRIGYIRLSQFTTDTPKEFDRAMESLLADDLEALVLDLRTNPGGVMSAAIEIVDRMIDEGTIVSTRGARSAEQVQQAKADGTYPRFHLVILIDQGSASAAEIVAGSLQDHRRAVIVGQRSWGKGSVQRIIRLPESGAAVKLTTDYYYLPKGRCVHRLPDAETWGVQPDIVEEMDSDKFSQLRDLLNDLTIKPLTDARQNHSPPPADPNQTPEQMASQQKAQRAQQLLQLDPQLAQAVKQCKGLLRARPSLQGLAETFTE